MKLDPYLLSYAKIKPKWIKDKYNNKNYKILRKNIGQKLHDIGFVKYFLTITPKAQATQEKDKLHFIKYIKLCASKYHIKKVKMQPTEWENIFRDHISDKGLISRICIELLKLNNKKPQPD